MSEDNIPTTATIREWASYVPNGTIGMHISSRDAAAFDRWLAAHNAEIRTQALKAAADQWSEWEPFRASDGIISIRQHGQTVSEWLRNRAAGA